MFELKLSQNISIAGSTSSGKSHLTMKLLREQLWNQLDILIILSPTACLSGDFSEFKENHDPDKGKIVYKFKDKFKEVLNETLEQQEALFEYHKKKEIPNIVIVIDDCVGHPILRYKGIVDKLSTKSRHLHISLITLVQRISAIPRTLRLNTRTFIVFNTANFSELQRMCEELVPKSMKKNLEKHIIDIYNEDYNYLLVNCFATRIRDRVWLNGKVNVYDMIMPSVSDKPIKK